MSAADAATSTGTTIALVEFPFLERWTAGILAAQVTPVPGSPDGREAVSVAALAGLECSGAARKQVFLSLQVGGSGARVLVDAGGAADLLYLQHEAIHPMPPLLAARHRLIGLRALGWTADGRDNPLVLLFDWNAPLERDERLSHRLVHDAEAHPDSPSCNLNQGCQM